MAKDCSKKPCKECPFKKGATWRAGFGIEGAEAKVYALIELDEQKIFACHKSNPGRSIFDYKRMKNNDCSGYRQMLENMQEPNKNPDIVNCFNETGPADFDLEVWKQGNFFANNLKLI